jgi:hypothetical protein
MLFLVKKFYKKQLSLLTTPKVHKELKVSQDLQVQSEKQDQLESKAFKVLLEPLVQRDRQVPLVPQVQQVPKGTKAFKASKVLRVLLVALVLLAQQDRQVHKEQQAILVPLGLRVVRDQQDLLVRRILRDRKVTRVFKGSLDPQERLDRRVSKETKVYRE